MIIFEAIKLFFSSFTETIVSVVSSLFGENSLIKLIINIKNAFSVDRLLCYAIGLPVCFAFVFIIIKRSINKKLIENK